MRYVVDAHVLLWYFADSPRLSAAADAILSDPINVLVLPATVYAEACWIVDHGRVPGLSVADI